MSPPLPDKAPASGDVVDVFLATRGVRTLRAICIVWLVAVIAVNVQHYVAHGERTTQHIAPLSILFLGTVLWLLWRQQVRTATSAFLWGLVVLVAAAAPEVAGLQTPVLLALPVVVTLSSWLLGVRQGWWLLALTGLYLAGLAYAQTLGLTGTQSRDPAFWALAYFFICLLGAVFGSAMARGVREQYGKALALGDELREANANLESKVAERTAELSAALDRLKQTQDDLIQSEKLASLGSMVAGIAHELNTPIGNALTVSSSMSDRLRQLDAVIQGPALRRSELVGAVSSLTDMCALVERSSERAAALVASFKQVAVDQISERRRGFDLREVVEENLAALRTGMKTQPWTVANAVPAGIDCDSFPGPLGQVLTNLIQNAVLHGFAGQDHGSIRIEAAEDGQHVSLTVTDDGVGMDTATSLRIFEPFFTTKLGKGGSGLGLAICFRIVTTILAGEIRVVSSPGSGSQFIVRMPRRTPGAL